MHLLKFQRINNLRTVASISRAPPKKSFGPRIPWSRAWLLISYVPVDRALTPSFVGSPPARVICTDGRHLLLESASSPTQPTWDAPRSAALSLEISRRDGGSQRHRECDPRQEIQPQRPALPHPGRTKRRAARSGRTRLATSLWSLPAHQRSPTSPCTCHRTVQ